MGHPGLGLELLGPPPQTDECVRIVLVRQRCFFEKGPDSVQVEQGSPAGEQSHLGAGAWHAPGCWDAEQAHPMEDTDTNPEEVDLDACRLETLIAELGDTLARDRGEQELQPRPPCQEESAQEDEGPAGQGGPPEPDRRSAGPEPDPVHDSPESDATHGASDAPAQGKRRNWQRWRQRQRGRARQCDAAVDELIALRLRLKEEMGAAADALIQAVARVPPGVGSNGVPVPSTACPGKGATGGGGVVPALPEGGRPGVPVPPTACPGLGAKGGGGVVPAWPSGGTGVPVSSSACPGQGAEGGGGRVPALLPTGGQQRTACVEAGVEQRASNEWEGDQRGPPAQEAQIAALDALLAKVMADSGDERAPRGSEAGGQEPMAVGPTGGRQGRQTPPSTTAAMSTGSMLHAVGRCRPCAWFWKTAGCLNGQDCARCHLCPEGELKVRRKAKDKAMRVGALPARQGLNSAAGTGDEAPWGNEAINREHTEATDWVFSKQGHGYEKHCGGMGQDRGEQGLVVTSEGGSSRGRGAAEELACGDVGEDEHTSDKAASQPRGRGPPLPAQGLSLATPRAARGIGVTGRPSETMGPLGEGRGPSAPPSAVLASMTAGSAQHATGRCMPCAWFWKPSGCMNGQACARCHLCPEGELKARRKAKDKALRIGAMPARQGPSSMASSGDEETPRAGRGKGCVGCEAVF